MRHATDGGVPWSVRYVCVALLFSASLPTASQAGVSVALVPDATTVQPGTDFLVHIEVTQAGDAFNGYDARIAFDPSALTFVEESPLALQEGSAMTSACPYRFHYFDPDPLPLTISHVLLCAELTLTGPGEIYVLRFHAGDLHQQTEISFQSVEFYNAGYTVPLASATNATILIGDPTDTSPRWPADSSVHLAASPNPFNPRATIELYAPIAGEQTLEVFDVRGMLIRTLDHGWFGAGIRSVLWDGRDDHGTGVASGTYIVRFRSTAGEASKRLVLLK